MRAGKDDTTGTPGLAVDAHGGAVIDPTKNVEDLVESESAHAIQIREGDRFLYAELRKADTLRQDDLRNALDRRLTDMSTLASGYEVRIENIKILFGNQIEAVKSDYGKQIATILANQSDKSAQLLANQVEKFARDFGDRLALVEKNQYVSGGQSAARDPALDRKLDDLASTIAKLNKSDDTGTGKGIGQDKVVAYVVAAIGLAIAAMTYISVHPGAIGH